MADLIELTAGDVAWHPHDSDPPLVLDRYDVPTLGVLRQHGVCYLFRQLDDVDEGSIWAYTRLTDDDAELLYRATPNQIDELVAAYAKLPAVLGLASASRILVTTAVDDLSTGCVISGFEVLSDELEERIRLAQSGRRILSAVG